MCFGRKCLLLCAVFLSAPWVCAFEEEDCPRCPEYQGPVSSEALIGYWPFDKYEGSSGITNQLTKVEVDDEDEGLLVMDKAGPFAQGGTSYQKANVSAKNIFIYKRLVSMTSFTLSFYLFLTPNPDDATLRPFTGIKADLEYFVVLYNRSHINLHVHESSTTIIGDYYFQILEAKGNVWNFVAITFDVPRKTISVYDSSAKFHGSRVHKFNERGYSKNAFILVGPWRDQPGCRFACVQFYSEALSHEQVARLPCVCKMAAKCPNDIEFDLVPVFSGPRKTSLLGFWPLDHHSGLHEEAFRREFVTLYATPAENLETKSPGPFPGLPRRLHIPVAEGFSLAAYLVPNILVSSLTVSFYLYQASRGIKPDTVLLDSEVFSLEFRRGTVVSLLRKPDRLVLSNFAPAIIDENNPEWGFVAFSYSISNNLLKTFREDGEVSSEKDCSSTPLVPGKAKMEVISIGPNISHSAIACLTMYADVLSPEEVALMRCVCRTRGKCQEQVVITSTSTSTETPSTTTVRTSSTVSTTRTAMSTTPRPPYGGPEGLIGLWLFDDTTRLNDFLNRFQTVSKATSEQARLSEGPFGNSGTSYQITAQGASLVALEGVPLAESFTIAFYLHTTRSKDPGIPGTPFEFRFDEIGFSFGIRYSGSSFTPLLNGQVPSGKNWNGGPLREDSWNFIAMTYNKGETVFDFYSTSGAHLDISAKFKNISDWQEMYLNLTIGKLLPRDRMACFMIFGRALPQHEIGRLSCVCKTRAKCPEDHVFRKRPFSGPAGKYLTGFWPMIDAEETDGVFDEMVYGRPPTEPMSPLRFHPPETAPGPFSGLSRGKKIPLHSTIRGDSMVATFKDVKLPGSFTVSFYLFTTSGEFDDKVLSIWREGYQLEFSTDNEKLVIKENGEKLIEIPDLVFSDWSFIAATYDANLGILTIFDEFGRVFDEADVEIRLKSNVHGQISIGPTYRRKSALICLTLFNRTLTGDQISRLRCVCRNVGNCTHRRAFFAPRPDSLVGYWPLDEQSLLNETIRLNPVKINQQFPVKIVNLPYERGSRISAVTVEKHGEISSYKFPTGIPKTFTITFRFYKGPSNVKGSIFSFTEGNKTLRFVYNFGKIIVENGGETLTAEALRLRPNSWNFLAITYENRTLAFYNASGNVNWEFSNVSIGGFGEGCLFHLGEIEPGDALSCFQIYAEALFPSEISHLRCVCETRGMCYEALPLNMANNYLPTTSAGPSRRTRVTRSTTSNFTTTGKNKRNYEPSSIRQSAAKTIVLAFLTFAFGNQLLF